MKKRIVMPGAAVVIVAGCLIFGSIFVLSATPGSSSDPIVSKSYVDEKYNELLAMLGGNAGGASSSAYNISEDEVLADAMERFEEYYADVLNGSSGRYVPVSANAGQIILGGEGTEIILRSGSATAYVSGSNGIVNVSDGSELFNNDAVKANNLLIVPREDGRGVAVKTDAWFIIKGSYQLLN